jgi:hypothetical protein
MKKLIERVLKNNTIKINLFWQIVYIIIIRILTIFQKKGLNPRSK